jgi:DNA-binding winged helix-turn-helix (wHTH) protein
MVIAARQVVVILSADRDWEHRLSGLPCCQYLDVRCITDPANLPHVSGENSESDTCLAGFIVDLAPPRQQVDDRCAPSSGSACIKIPQNEGYAVEESTTKWCVSVLLAMMPVLLHQPLVIVNHGYRLDVLFHRYGLQGVQQIDPNADDVTWQLVIGRMQIFARHMRDCPDVVPLHYPAVGHRSATAVPLNGGVWLDLEQCVLQTAHGTTALTAREVRVLKALAQHPGRLHSAAHLARNVARSAADYIDEHCIEQTISGLRKKLGESARESRLLISRRGLGYALITDEDWDTPSCN